MAKENKMKRQINRPPQRPKPQRQFRIEWILVPLAVLAMAYVLGRTSSVLSWEKVMDYLDVQNRKRYTMLFHLCLAVTCIVAAVRILGTKKRK